MAAGTIDAGVKIYAVRVDAVHADTYKVLGGLGKESAPTKDVGSPEEGVQFTPFLLSSSWFHPQYFCNTPEFQSTVSFYWCIYLGEYH